MSSSDAFSTAAESTINTQVLVDIQKVDTPPPWTELFNSYYAIEETVRVIKAKDFKCITLQFPDELLHDSVPVYRTLQSKLEGRQLHVLADTSYGACCVDEVTASHVDADVVVHYGHSCMSKTSRLPVIYVFGTKAFDTNDCVSAVVSYIRQIQDTLGDIRRLVLRHEVVYNQVAGEVARELQTELESWTVSHTPLPTFNKPAQPKNKIEANLETGTTTSNTSITDAEPPDIGKDGSDPRCLYLWLGVESPTLTNILITSGSNPVISYNPDNRSVQQETDRSNKMLMRRYALMQKSRDADVFGILVGTLGVANYLPLLAHLRQTLKSAHKKSYTISVGKINPSKLGNFMEIECWIWVACSESMIDSKEYLKQIISPFELGLVLNREPIWPSNYIFDFGEIIKANADVLRTGISDNEASEEEDEDRPMFSLATGKYRQAQRYDTDDSQVSSNRGAESSQALTTRTHGGTVAVFGTSAAASFLHSRTYQGLDPRVGQDTPGILEQGRSGIAKGYVDDRDQTKDL